MPLFVHVMSNVHTSRVYVCVGNIHTDGCCDLLLTCYSVFTCSAQLLTVDVQRVRNQNKFQVSPGELLRLQFAIHSLIDIESSWLGQMHLWWINCFYFFHSLTPDDTRWHTVKVFLGLNWKATGNSECQRLVTQWLGETQWHAAPRFEFGRLVTLSGGDWWHFE